MSYLKTTFTNTSESSLASVFFLIGMLGPTAGIACLTTLCNMFQKYKQQQQQQEQSESYVSLDKLAMQIPSLQVLAIAALIVAPTPIIACITTNIWVMYACLIAIFFIGGGAMGPLNAVISQCVEKDELTYAQTIQLISTNALGNGLGCIISVMLCLFFLGIFLHFSLTSFAWQCMV